jgi:hypothetical protein
LFVIRGFWTVSRIRPEVVLRVIRNRSCDGCAAPDSVQRRECRQLFSGCRRTIVAAQQAVQHGGACTHTCPPEVRSSGDNTDFRAGRFGDATEAQASGGELRTSSRRSGNAVTIQRGLNRLIQQTYRRFAAAHYCRTGPCSEVQSNVCNLEICEGTSASSSTCIVQQSDHRGFQLSLLILFRSMRPGSEHFVMMRVRLVGCDLRIARCRGIEKRVYMKECFERENVCSRIHGVTPQYQTEPHSCRRKPVDAARGPR